MPNFKLKYEDSENIKADLVNTVVFNLHRIKRRAFFWDTRYDVTDAVLQNIEKMKVQYLMSLLFDLFEILQVVKSEQANFA